MKGYIFFAIKNAPMKGVIASVQSTLTCVLVFIVNKRIDSYLLTASLKISNNYAASFMSTSMQGLNTKPQSTSNRIRETAMIYC